MRFPSPEFDSAVAELCHGTIGDADLTELHELLRADLDARDEYLWRVEVHGQLAATKIDFGASSTQQSADDPLRVLAAAPAAIATDAGQRSHFFAIAVAALLGAVMLGGGLWYRYGMQPATNVVASFTELHEVKWMTPSTEPQIGDSIHQGHRIELSSGSAEIEFKSGARMKMVGPTIIEPRSGNSVFLMLGEAHLVAETPESKGFTLVTRNSRFVDIGTAFTATVAPDGLSRLEVSEGEVNVVMNGVERSSRLRAGETLYVEPGERQIITRIESGDETSAFRFPTIAPPSAEDYADQAQGKATIQVVHGKLKFRRDNPNEQIEVLIDGEAQKRKDAPAETAFFENNTRGSFLMDLGRAVNINKINSYSWHQHREKQAHRHRATQRFTLFGFEGDEYPDTNKQLMKAGWTRIARVNTDNFFRVKDPLDRPSQQACSITAAAGDIGRYRYLLWRVEGVGVFNTFYGEIDVFASP